ncbi:precorrin-6A synthase (deacetylating) [Sulfitobacter sp. 1151]|uniref:Precorrin-6A synthase [deacetylating] n=2 Tax=Parasulfitobacter algicola TaxID=2614809 RepID=A0ABX2IV99_9RHOB|nr:precorrin-6A synthase (deacetylating) [Sulfitobacter algicola]NSX56839.1 precorrin-6A synthase (deacetylating) [Sulfitobacter algicola]
MTQLFLIGIGTGNPDHLTRQAHKAIAEADLILVPRKGDEKSDLADLRHLIVADVRADVDLVVSYFDMPKRSQNQPYLKAVTAWHDEIAQIWAAKISEHRQAQKIALMVWGDPALYDSTLRIAARLRPIPPITVIAGITSLQALAAAHAIPLNTLGGEIIVTTGRRLSGERSPENGSTVAVMLDGTCAFQQLLGQDLHIWWGAYLGMPQQLLMSGALDDVCQDIIKMRNAAREDHGWIMDTYILRSVQSLTPPLGFGLQVADRLRKDRN